MNDQAIIDQGVLVTHHFGGGVYIKECKIPAGMFLMQHTHEHDHLSVLVKGSAVVNIDDKSQLLMAPHTLLIRAGLTHSVQALTDIVWHCIWEEGIVDSCGEKT